MPAAPPFERLEIERDGPLLRVWLARPERRNALDTRALEEVARVFEGLATDWETRCVVLGGRGPSFCAGADRRAPPGAERMRRSAGATAREVRHAAQLGRRACLAVERAEVPTVARIHGHAVGGGLALALACDFRVAAEDALFHVPEVDLGIPLLWGAAARLVHEVGAARAREIILLCDRLDAATAAAWSVVHRVVPAARLDAETDGLARRLADKPEIAVHMTKTQMRALAATARLGDVSETDGDLLREASREGVARQAFAPDGASRGPRRGS